MKKYPLYQPRMSDENVRRIYELKERTGRPMTEILNEIIECSFAFLSSEEFQILTVDSREPN